MAKRKKPTALFEVFQQHTQSSNGRSSWKLRAPNWLGRRKSEDAPGALAMAPVCEPDPTASADRFALMRIDDDEPLAPSRPSVRVMVDSTEQTIKLVLSYGSAAVAGFALLVVLALTFVLGKHSVKEPLPLLADRTTEEVRHDAPRREVLNVAAEPAIVPEVVTNKPLSKTAPQVKWNDPARPPATFVADDEERIIGMNYVIIQSYPDKKDADAAQGLLVKRGIFCTVEPTPANWFSNNGQTWYSVIGIKGFSKIRDSDEFKRYIASIMQVSDEFAGKVRFKRFEPTPYKWRETKK
jgi:hypothetical protein